MWKRNLLQVASYEPYFVKISNCEHSRSLLSFDPSMHKWHNVPISYLPSEIGFPVSSGGGLICFSNKLQAHMRDECGVLFVSNPLNKTWKELPRFLSKQRPVLVSMVMWRRPSHYKVIVAGVMSTEIYDSVAGEWLNTGCLPCGEEVSRNVAYCNGSLYCLTPLWYNCVLLAFSIQDEVWTKVKTGRLPGYCQFRNLVTCKGHIVIVGKSLRHQVLSVCVWLLEWKTMKWRETGRMPQRMSDHFLGRPSESFYCCSHGDLIFLTWDKCDMGLLFDLGQNMWRWVVGFSNLDGFSFESRLDSQV